MPATAQRIVEYLVNVKGDSEQKLKLLEKQVKEVNADAKDLTELLGVGGLGRSLKDLSEGTLAATKIFGAFGAAILVGVAALTVLGAGMIKAYTAAADLTRRMHEARGSLIGLVEPETLERIDAAASALRASDEASLRLSATIASTLGPSVRDATRLFAGIKDVLADAIEGLTGFLDAARELSESRVFRAVTAVGTLGGSEVFIRGAKGLQARGAARETPFVGPVLAPETIAENKRKADEAEKKAKEAETLAAREAAEALRRATEAEKERIVEINEFIALEIQHRAALVESAKAFDAMFAATRAGGMRRLETLTAEQAVGLQGAIVPSAFAGLTGAAFPGAVEAGGGAMVRISPESIDALSSGLSGGLSGIASMIAGPVVGGIITLIQDGDVWIKQILVELRNFPKELDRFITVLVRSLPKIVEGLIEALPKIVAALIKGIPDIIEAVLNLVPVIIVDVFIKLLPRLAAMIGDALNPFNDRRGRRRGRRETAEEAAIAENLALARGTSGVTLQSGGYVSQTGRYLLHAGEQVVPSHGAATGTAAARMFGAGNQEIRITASDRDAALQQLVRDLNRMLGTRGMKLNLSGV